MSLKTGERALGRYTVGTLLGEGGMGQVWRAEHSDLGMTVALKVLLGERDAVSLGRFKREAQLMAKVRHPNVVSVLDYGTLDDGSPCIVMEYVQGESLENRIARGVQPWSVGLEVFRGLLRGLGAIHGEGLVHRDLKPSNVVIAPGNPETPKLIDFGIARPVEEGVVTRFTSTGMIVGTPAYMPPEQFMGGTVDSRSDVYAAALILYEILTGTIPFANEANIMACVFKRANLPIPPPVAPAGLPPIPEALALAVMAALRVDPNQRPDSAKAFFGLLRESVLSNQAPPPAYAPPVQAPAVVQVPREEALQQTMASGVGVVPGAMPPPPSARSGIRSTWLVGARLPPSRLGHPEDRRFLSELAENGRAFVFGGQFWFALQASEGGPEVVQTQAEGMVGALSGRFGALVKARWCPVGEDFQLTAAALSGAAPLPPVLGDLLKQLRSA